MLCSRRATQKTRRGVGLLSKTEDQAMTLVASKEVISAVENGDVEAVDRALRGGMSPDAVHEESHWKPTLLLVAAEVRWSSGR